MPSVEVERLYSNGSFSNSLFSNFKIQTEEEKVCGKPSKNQLSMPWNLKGNDCLIFLRNGETF